MVGNIKIWYWKDPRRFVDYFSVVKSIEEDCIRKEIKFLQIKNANCTMRMFRGTFVGTNRGEFLRLLHEFSSYWIATSLIASRVKRR